ncbi:MAG TPA: HIT domain-containing protein, partial [Acidimicrobiales bacterium]
RHPRLMGGPPGMDRLWAGWRSTYVAAAGNGALAGEGSLFTRILASGLPDEETHVVWRGELAFAILNAYPYTSGHLLVMPYREVGELEDMTDAESAEVWAGVRHAVVAIKRAYRPHGVNIGANLGEAAGAGVPSHVHLHVLPRWNADSNFMTSVAEVRVLPETLGDSWRKLHDAWPA